MAAAARALPLTARGKEAPPTPAAAHLESRFLPPSPDRMGLRRPHSGVRFG